MIVTEINSARKTQKALYRNIKNVNPVKIENGDKIIGMTMLTDNKKSRLFAVKAQFEDETEHPYTIRVLFDSNNKKTVHDIDVRNVNPKDASMIEIFALCSYCDNKKVSNGSAFGSFRELKNYTKKSISIKDFIEKRVDWETQINQIREEFLKAGLFYQYQSCLQLLDIFDYAVILALGEKEEDTTKSEITIQEWKKEAAEYKDVRDAVAQLMKKELF